MRGFVVGSSLALVLGLAVGAQGCAQGGAADTPDATGRIDAQATIDAPISDVDAQPLVDANQTPDAPVACTPIRQQLLVNEAFDDAPLGTGWEELPQTAGTQIIVDSATLQDLSPDSAPNLAWLGGYDTLATDVVRQTLTFPADAEDLVLTGKILIGTIDSDVFVFDEFYIDITDTAGNILAELGAWSNLDAGAAAFETFVVDVGAFAGQTVRLEMTALLDDSLRTNFFVDSLLLEGTACP